MSTPPPFATAAWTTETERSNVHVLRVMRWIAVTLGRRVSRLVLHPVSLYFLLFGRTAARASADYLRHVHGRPPRWSERYRHIHHFAATILDRVYLLREEFELFDIEIRGVEHIDAVLASGNGAFLVGAHIGSFEVLRALGQAHGGARVAMLMYEHNARLLMATLRAIAPETPLRVIGLGRMGAMLELRDWLDGGGVAGLLADRTLQGPGQAAASGGRSRMHWVDFLGEPAGFSDGAFRLAALLRRPVVFMAGLYLGGGRYQLRFEPLADFSGLGEIDAGGRQQAQDQAVREALGRYVRILEQQCRDAPGNWFNFFDFWAGSPGPRDDTHHATAESR